MRNIHYVLCVILLAVMLLASFQNVYARGGGYHRIHKICAEIQADKVKVAEDRKEIQTGRQALKAAKISKDKARIEQSREKLKRDTQQYKEDKTKLEKCED